MPTPGPTTRGLPAAVPSHDPLVAALEAAFYRLIDGDDAAVTDIVALSHQRFMMMAHNTLRRYPHVRAKYRTSDVLHETYPDILNTLKGLPIASPLVFLRCVGQQIRWTLQDLARKVSRRPDVTGVYLGEKPGKANDPADAVLWGEVHQWVEELEDEDRQLFDLICYCGLTHDEVAARLKVCDRTIRRKWQHLKVAFGKKFPDMASLVVKV